MIKLRYALSLLKAVLSRAPRGSVCLEVSSWAPLFSVQRWANRYPLAYALLLDLRSVAHRIAEMRDRGLAYNGLALIAPEREEHRVSADELQSRSEGIQNLSKARPWTALIDHLIFLEGFEAGARYQSRISDKSKHEETWRAII
jgi:hypothetical protein